LREIQVEGGYRFKRDTRLEGFYRGLGGVWVIHL
jgi:hypothetical protein